MFKISKLKISSHLG